MAFDKNKYTHEYTTKYYYRPCVMIPRSYKSILRAAAESHAGNSVSAFIQNAVKKELVSLGYELPESEKRI